MNKFTFLSAVSVFALAVGFTSGAFAQACNPGDSNCLNVKVTVQGGQVSIEPATITVTPRAKPAVKIVWYVATPGYTFADQAVNFPAAYFMSTDKRFCYLWTSSTAYVCTDWNADAFPWGTDYTIKVQGSGGPLTGTGRVVNN